MADEKIRDCWFEVWNQGWTHRRKAGYFHDETDLFKQLETRVSPLGNWKHVYLCEPMDYRSQQATLYMEIDHPEHPKTEQETKDNIRRKIDYWNGLGDIFGHSRCHAKYQMVIVEKTPFTGYESDAQMANPYLSMCIQ